MAEGGKSFNSIDNKDQLMLVEIKDGKYGGYKQDLLLGTLSKIEIKVCVCIGCTGLGRDACNVGEEQNLMCENCVPEGSMHTPLKVARDELPFISAKCPLHTRGCVWKDIIGTLIGHLDECEYFVVNCTNDCQMILQRMELVNHLAKDCTHRNVTCEHCNGTVMFKDLTSHHETCPEFPLVCKNECGGTFKRKEMQGHVDNDCPNTVLPCGFKVFGCGTEKKRCELAEHLNAEQLAHLNCTKEHSKSKFEYIESTFKQLQEEKVGSNQLTELQQKIKEFEGKLGEREKENVSATAENKALKTEVEALKKTQTDANTQIETSKKAQTELEKKSKELEGKLGGSEKENQTLKTEVEALKKAQTDANTQIETSKKAQTELEKKLKELEGKLGGSEKENASATAENKALKTEVEALKKTQTDANTQIETSKKAQTELEKKSKELEGKLGGSEKENQTLKAEVEALKKAQTALKTEFEAFKKEILAKIPAPPK